MHVQNIQFFSFTFSTVKDADRTEALLCFHCKVHVHLCDKKSACPEQFPGEKAKPKCPTYFSLSCCTSTLYQKLNLHCLISYKQLDTKNSNLLFYIFKKELIYSI